MPTEVVEKPRGVQEKPLFAVDTFINSARLLSGELNDKGEININIRLLKDATLFINELEKFGILKVRIWTKYRPKYQNRQSEEKPMDLFLSPNASVSLITDSYERLGKVRMEKNVMEKIRFPNFLIVVPSFEQLTSPSFENPEVEISTPHGIKIIRPEIRKAFLELESEMPGNWRLNPRTTPTLKQKV